MKAPRVCDQSTAPPTAWGGPAVVPSKLRSVRVPSTPIRSRRPGSVAGVAADVDGLPAGGHGGEGVASAVVDPGGLERGPGGAHLPAGDGVAQRPRVEAAVGDHHEVAAVE